MTQEIQLSISSDLDTHLYQVSKFPGTGFWRWINMDWHTNVSPEELDWLKAHGWELVEPRGSRLADIFALHSHLAPSLMLFAHDTPYDFTISGQWVMTNDLTYAEQYPVVLTHQIPVAAHLSEEAVKQIAAPNAMLAGTEALIFNKATADVSLYHLESLGDTGKKLQEEIQSKIIPLPHSLNGLLLSEREKLHRNKAWQQARRAARELAQLYWQHHLDKQHATKHLQDLPCIFPHKTQEGLTLPIIIPAALSVRGALSAFSNGHNGAQPWSPKQQIPSFLIKSASDSALIQYKPEGYTLQGVEDLTKVLWDQVNQLSDIDGDVLLACLAQWMNEHDSEGLVWITSDHILNYRGIQPRQYIDAQGTKRASTHRLEDLQSIHKSMQRISNLFVTTQEWSAEPRTPGKRGRPKKRQLQLQDKLLHIEKRFVDSTAFDDGRNEELAIAWLIRLGKCVPTLSTNTNRQVAYLFQQALIYDPFREKWEKRLARYFMMRLQDFTSQIILCLIQDMLLELGFLIDAKNPDRGRHRFEQALDRLVQDQLIGSWCYQEDIHALPSKKWVQQWQSYHLQVEASPLIKELEDQRRQKISPAKKEKRPHSDV
ncbi:hypothetical protein [Ktedonospora formicarum]|uniref:Uncharacterized protein n=1 Tax=Ktedonospora formicarum TaxID=2778364 RepID=A0A8J3MZ44_9CHLR|nr:hypothetical protein [Ktedonospora formicarum]GHO51433.1 hypothetical protein KSX_95960 [Ktedonospora formicarum]